MCGVIGIQGSSQAALEVYQGLQLLQHRGQDAAGILSFDEVDQQFHLHKEKGLVSQVFNQKNLSKFKGQLAIGHTRYATIAAKDAQDHRDLQPMLVNYPHGIGLVHNGNVINVAEISEKLRDNYHRIMLSKNDAEALLNIISSQLQEYLTSSPLDQLKAAAGRIFDDAIGGYAIVSILANGHMVGMRDPNGIRPLILGRKLMSDGQDAHILASESNVLSFLGYEIVRDLVPGEIVVISSIGKVESAIVSQTHKKNPCMFEWIYFSTPESIIDGTPVYQARLNLGKSLGKKIKKLIDSKKMEVDLVVPVPDTGRGAAVTLSEYIGSPYREVLIKNRYIQRSFILKDQETRNQALDLKLMVVESEIKDKNILIVDDSIVRGTTSKKLVELVRAAGAKKVYLVSTCPPIKYPCYFGIDFPLREELISAHCEPEQIADLIGADEVIFQELDGLKDSLEQEGLCLGCITGCYPMDLKDNAQKFQMQRRQTDREIAHG